jgi:hypothetical protein
MAKTAPTANVRLLPIHVLPFRLPPIMLAIGRSFDVLREIAVDQDQFSIKTNQRLSIASKTLETTPVGARSALPWNAMRESNNHSAPMAYVAYIACD